MKALLVLFTNNDSSAKQYHLQLGNGFVCISPDQNEDPKPAKHWVDLFNSKAGNGKYAEVEPLDFYDTTEVTKEDLEVVEVDDKHQYLRDVHPIETMLAGIQNDEQYLKYAAFTAEPYES